MARLCIFGQSSSRSLVLQPLRVSLCAGVYLHTFQCKRSTDPLVCHQDSTEELLRHFYFGKFLREWQGSSCLLGIFFRALYYSSYCWHCRKKEKRYFSLKIKSRNTCNFLVLLCFWMMKRFRVCIKRRLTLLTEQKATNLLACKKEKENLEMKESYILPHS